MRGFDVKCASDKGLEGENCIGSLAVSVLPPDIVDTDPGAPECRNLPRASSGGLPLPDLRRSPTQLHDYEMQPTLAPQHLSQPPELHTKSACLLQLLSYRRSRLFRRAKDYGLLGGTHIWFHVKATFAAPEVDGGCVPAV